MAAAAEGAAISVVCAEIYGLTVPSNALQVGLSQLMNESNSSLVLFPALPLPFAKCFWDANQSAMAKESEVRSPRGCLGTYLKMNVNYFR